MHVHSFAPVADRSSTVLVLGSMPGKVSLAANRYYAHPRNAFWRIAGAVLRFDPDAPYRARLDALLRNRIALWDVLQTCTRSSSLDSDIVESSMVANDFAGFLDGHPAISLLLFNGARSESAFRKLVAPTLPTDRRLALTRLPSTSPANASIPYERKLREWRRALRPRDAPRVPAAAPGS